MYFSPPFLCKSVHLNIEYQWLFGSKLLNGCYLLVVTEMVLNGAAPPREVQLLLLACVGGGQLVLGLQEEQVGICCSFTLMMSRDSRFPPMSFLSWVLVSWPLLLFSMSWVSCTLCEERLKKVQQWKSQFRVNFEWIIT